MKRSTASTTHFVSFTALGLLAIGIVGTTVAGIQGSGFVAMSSVGEITEPDSGSFTVNGVQYAADNARITKNGVPANANALQAGHVVTIHGSVSPDGTTGIADEVSLVSNVVGRITARDTQGGTLSVLGQTVRLTDETIIEGDLAIGTSVDVSGFANSAGDIVASRVDVVPNASNGQVRGTVAGLDANAQTFLINTLLVDYASAALFGNLADGASVSVASESASSAGVLEATRVDVLGPAGASGERGDVAGLITSFTSAADFFVNGQRVVGDESTIYILQGGTLGPDVAVEVSGRFADGVLVADRVKTKKARKK